MLHVIDAVNRGGTYRNSSPSNTANNNPDGGYHALMLFQS